MPYLLQQQKHTAQENFRKMLENISIPFDQEAADSIRRFASHFHNLAAQEITSVIRDFIIGVSSNTSPLTFCHLMDLALGETVGLPVRDGHDYQKRSGCIHPALFVLHQLRDRLGAPEGQP